MSAIKGVISTIAAWTILAAVVFISITAGIHLEELGQANAARLNHEKTYQQTWCDAAHGQTEVVLPDRTRVDCLTDRFAVEVDFADKWAEGIGQALHYGQMTGKPPAILLILEHPKQHRFLTILCHIVTATEPRITVFVTGPAAPLTWTGCLSWQP
jgi:hypothetical protein